jgi:hypothetical protein
MFSVRHVALGRGTSRPGRLVNRHRYQSSNRLINITIAPTASLPYSIRDDSRPRIYIAVLSIPKLKCRQYHQTAMDFSTRVHEFPTTYPNTWPSQSETDREPLKEGKLTITPILNSGTSVFGAEVSGIDWNKPVPEEIVHQVGNTAIHVQSMLELTINSLSSYKTSML